MSTNDHEIREIRETLQALSRRIAALEVVPEAVASPPSPPARRDPRAGAPAAAPSALGAAPECDPHAGLREGFSALEETEDVKAFPRYFARFAKRCGLRMLLLKRWNSRLDVLIAEGVEMLRGAGDREIAPDRIAVKDDDLFAALASDHCVYAGPVPVRHFPLELSLLLGRGQDRWIVLLPLPLRGRWNTFIYLDAGCGGRGALAEAELLARYALARLMLLDHGDRSRPNRSATILQDELARRGGKERAAPAPAPSPAPSAVAPAPAPAARRGPDEPEDDPADAPAALANLVRGVGREIDAPEPSPRPPLQEAPRPQPPSAPPARGAMAIAANGHEGPPPDAAALAATVGDLPALPRVAHHILALIADPSTTAAKLEQGIVLDQALTAKILKIANSSFYGGLRDVNTVREAVVRLGFVTIRNWTLVTAARAAFLEGVDSPTLQRIWKQSILSAMASQLVAEQVRHASPEAVFVGGLMQNIGQLALARSAPELFEEIVRTSAEAGMPYHVVERDLLGFDHGDLGALMIREWKLSAELEEAVRWHHRLDQGEPSRLAAIVALGEEVADCSATLSDEGLAVWEMSTAARLLEVGEPAYIDLLERARRLRMDPRLFA